MFLLSKSALVLVAVAMSRGHPLAGAESLQGQLDHVIQGWQTGWVADPPVRFGEPAPRSELFRWRRNGAVLTIELREMADASAALADVDATPRLLSTGAAAVDGIGDRAYIAGMGGFNTVYVAAGSRVFVLDVRDTADVVKALATRVAPVIKAYTTGRS